MARFKKGSKVAKDYMRRIRNSKRKVYNIRSPVMSMARRRRSSRALRFKRYSKRSAFGNSEIMGLALGTGLYTAYKIWLAPTLQSSVPQLAGSMPIVETVGGYLLAKNKNKFVRDFGKVAFTFGLFQLVNQYVVPMAMGVTASSGTSAY